MSVVRVQIDRVYFLFEKQALKGLTLEKIIGRYTKYYFTKRRQNS